MVGVSDEVASAELCRDEEVVVCAIRAEAMSDAISIAAQEHEKLAAMDQRSSARSATVAVARAAVVAAAPAADRASGVPPSSKSVRRRGKRGSSGAAVAKV